MPETNMEDYIMDIRRNGKDEFEDIKRLWRKKSKDDDLFFHAEDLEVRGL